MLTSILFALALAQTPAQTASSAVPAPATSPAKVPWAVQFDLPSKITGRTYRIYVAKPLGAPPKAGWPVVYVLDADIMYPSIAAQMVVRSATSGKGAIVVGVAYPNALATMKLRNRDLTPSQPNPNAMALAGDPQPKSDEYGGAADFHRFMMEELRPVIAASNSVDPANQSLIGYSFGGLFGLSVMFHHPEAYRTYVIGSPSIWWNDSEVLRGEKAFSAAVRAGTAAPRILITSDQWEQDANSPEIPNAGHKREEALRQMNDARMVDNARELAARLAALHGASGYRVHYTLFPEETHLTGMPAAGSRGFVFAMGD